jgi:hypothetical protein
MWAVVKIGLEKMFFEIPPHRRGKIFAQNYKFINKNHHGGVSRNTCN